MQMYIHKIYWHCIHEAKDFQNAFQALNTWKVYTKTRINISSSNFKQSQLIPDRKYCKINKTTLDHLFPL